MSRALKLFILAGILAMIGLFAASLWAHWDTVAHLQTLPPLLKKRVLGALFGGVFCPVWLGLGAWLMDRQLTRRDIALAPDHRRFYEASTVIGVVFTTAAEAWIVFGAEHMPFAGRGVVMRGVLVFCGVFAAVYGNFHAKAGPPSGELAPAPAVWIRGMLRNGWAMVLLGLAIVVLAIALPLKLLPFLLWGMVAAAVPIWRSQFRLMWPSRKARPPAPERKPALTGQTQYDCMSVCIHLERRAERNLASEPGLTQRRQSPARGHRGSSRSCQGRCAAVSWRPARPSPHFASRRVRPPRRRSSAPGTESWSLAPTFSGSSCA